jgi:signal transduction histidine kinase
MMRRLYLQFYLTLIASLLLFAALSSLVWLWIGPPVHEHPLFDRAGEILASTLPGPERPAVELEAALARLTDGVPASATVRARDGRVLAAVGPALDPPVDAGGGRRPLPGWGGPSMTVRLPDGRLFLMRETHRSNHGMALAPLLLLSVVMALGAYPLVRRLTRRLEALRARVDELGAGDLSARVAVAGRDEVADLARSFNRAAERIETVVGAQRRLLASVSHELRSPLARLRMATELLPGTERPDLRVRIARDIADLDALIGELLLASRLDAGAAEEADDDVDLLALLADECARQPELDTQVHGEPITLRASPRLLRRLVRNLLENARRHAAGAPVELRIARSDGIVRLQVLDRGPGVASGERDKIFEPFYRPPGAKETDGGVGLGLALVRQIARHHGGDARCIGREGGGTFFEVTLAQASARLGA